MAAAVAAVPPPVLLPVIVPPVVVPPLVAAAPNDSDGSDRGPQPQRPEPTFKNQRTATGQPLSGRFDVAAPPESFRIGYVDYLRTAGTLEIAAAAAPGVVGIMALTGAGGFFGYRQAKAGLAVRTGTARFIG
ncbi:hypothetical protein M1247_02665 [Mycobacterium sp. 21AC1]|uniref:hypothetical protein n=1 Tax=[Mycobacterium] appelbergii TaxID=2939269 RepID=UPI002938FF3B|nr:hypothetical protein [Mycobacterium sp. 21AC1]MDV3123809.1 hypothetical protein [Mycobacterium sp. 21AC1]